MDLFERQAEFIGLAKKTKKNNRKDIVKSIFDYSLNGTGKKRVCEKTPQHLGQVNRILKDFPSCRIICIIRDGRDAIPSLLRVPWTHNNAKRHANEWRWSVATAMKLRKKHPENFIIIKYEEFITDTESCLSTICQFIGENYYAQDFAHSDSQISVPSWETNWKQISLKTIDKSKISLWKKESSEKIAEYERFLMPELEKINYKAAFIKKISLLNSLIHLFEVSIIQNKYRLQDYILGRKQGFNFVRRNEWRK